MVKWHKLEEFDYQAGDILLLMKVDPKKKVWRSEQGLQPEGKDYKVRDDIVTYSSYTRDQVESMWGTAGSKIWEQGHWNPDSRNLAPIKRVGDTLRVWHMSRTAWDSIVAWMWKRDLVREYLEDSQ